MNASDFHPMIKSVFHHDFHQVMKRYGERNREGLLSKLQINRPVLLKSKIKFVKRFIQFFFNRITLISEIKQGEIVLEDRML